MNINRLQRQVEEMNMVRGVLELAGMNIEQFCQINAVSEAEHNFANDLKVTAVSSAWKGIEDDYQNAAFAQALLQSVLDHQDARFWCEHEMDWQSPTITLSRLEADIERHLGA